MKEYQHKNYRYTARFCEENIWWLARSLADEGLDSKQMNVLFLSNSTSSIVVLNQRASPQGGAMLWDYHVILDALIEDERWIFDFDTRLNFPEKKVCYMSNTFPSQSAIPLCYRTRVRIIPATSFLRHFSSDRSHMEGYVPAEEFPPGAPIQAALNSESIDIRDYWDSERDISETQLVDLDEYMRDES